MKLQLKFKLEGPKCTTLTVTNIEDPLEVTFPDIPRESQMLMGALTEKFFYIGKKTLERFQIATEVQVFLDTIYLVSSIGLIQHGGEWEPYIAVGLSSKAQLCTAPGHFTGEVEYIEGKGDCLILRDSSDEYGYFNQTIPLKEIEFLQIRLQS